MADRFPIILNTSANQLQEIASGDTLDVSGAAVKANLVDSLSVVGTGVSVAGVVTATSFVGSGANLSGIDISAVKDSGGNVKIQAEASGAIYTGIHTFGSTTSFTNGVFNGTVTSTGAVVNGDSDLNGDIDVEGDLDVDGHTNLDNVSVAGVTTFSGAITGTSAILSGNITANRFTGTDGNAITLGDSKKIVLGTGSDLQIFHDGTNSRIENDATNLFIQSNLINLTNAAGTEVLINANANGDVKLYYNGSSKLATTNTGINVTGNVVGDGLTIDGDSDLNGDLDVDGHTNLDNVSVAGVTTFAGTVNTASIVATGIDLNGDIDVDGHTNLDNVSVAGVSTFANDVIFDNALKILYDASNSFFRFGDNVKAGFGNNGDLEIYHTGTGSVINDAGTGSLHLRTGGSERITIGANSVGLAYGGNIKLETTSTGINVTGNVVGDGLTIDGDSDLNGDLDVDGHTNLDNLSVAGVTTFTGAINGSSAAFSGNATITGNLSVGGVLTYEDVKNVDSVGIATARVGLKVLAGGANVVGVVTAANGIFVPDNQGIHIGNVAGGGDLNLSHNGSHSYIKDSGTGSLLIQGSQVALQSTSGENMVTALADGAVQLMYDHSAKLATTNTGVSITGNIAVSGTVDGVDIASFKTSFDNLNTDLVADTSPQLGGDLDTNSHHILLDDNHSIKLGDGADAQLYHSGSHQYFLNTTGNMYFMPKSGEYSIACYPDGAVDLYYDNSKKLETQADGVLVSGKIQANGHFYLNDNYKAQFGNSQDLQIYHSGSNSFIKQVGTGDLYLQCDNGETIFLRPKSNEDGIKIINDGAVELYHNNNKKLETTSSGITVTGNATATTFIGALTGTASGNTTITNNADNRVVTGGSGNALNGESTLNYGSNVLSFNGSASVLSGTGNTFGGYLYRDGGSGYFYIDCLTTSSYTCGFKIRGYQNGTYTEHLQGFAGTTKIGSGGSSNRLVIQSNGQISVGGDTVRTINSHASRLQVQGNNYSDATVSIINNASDNNGAYLFFAKQRSGSAGGSTIVQSNDIIGQIRFSGADGTDLENPMAYIECRVDGTPGSNDMPGRLMFYTTADGSGSPTARMVIKNNGRVGINETNPSESLYVAGNIYATGNVTAYSDIRVKENVKEISNALEAVDKIRGVSYTRKDTKEDTLGVSAQEVETMFPELVVEDNYGMKSVNYNGLVGVLFSAVKELSTKLKEIENK